MKVAEFFSYLLGRNASHELAVQLVEVYRMRTPDQRATATSSSWIGR